MKISKNSLFLVGIIILASIVSFYPHFNYQYPLHVDEWFHISVAQEIANTGAFPNYDVYTGTPIGPSSGMEIAWHYFLSIFALAGFSVVAYTYLIPLVAIIAVLSVYYFARRWGTKVGLISAFLVAILPSNTLMGGTQMLIPVNLSLIFIPIALKHAFDALNRQNPKRFYPYIDYLIVLISTLILLYAHPPSAFVLLVILFPYIVLTLIIRKEIKKTLGLLLFVALAIILALPNYLGRLGERGVESAVFTLGLYLNQIPLIYGIIPSILFIYGFYLFIKSKKPEDLSIVASIIILILFVVIFAQTGIAYLIPYNRIIIPLMMLMSIPAAFATIEISRKIGTRYFIPIILAVILVLSLIGTTQTIYYHLIDDEDYGNLLWIKENTPKNSTILSDPFIARAVVPVSQRRVYTVLPFGADNQTERLNRQALDFLKGGCTYTEFLTNNNLSIIYSEKGCNNTDLVQIRERIYVLK